LLGFPFNGAEPGVVFGIDLHYIHGFENFLVVTHYHAVGDFFVLFFGLLSLFIHALDYVAYFTC
jgi:hypothetical protein